MGKPIAWDNKGVPILPGDLVRTFHYRDGRRNMYVYHVVFMDERQFLMARPYNEQAGSNCFRLIGKQPSTEVIYGLKRHEIDDQIIRPHFRQFVYVDFTGKKSLLCDHHERIRVKDE